MPAKRENLSRVLHEINSDPGQIARIQKKIGDIQKGKLKIVFAKTPEGKRVAYSLIHPKPFTVIEFERHIGESNWTKIRDDPKFRADLQAHGLNFDELKIGMGEYPTTHPDFRRSGRGYGRQVILQGEEIMKRNGAQIRIIVFSDPENVQFYEKCGYKKLPKGVVLKENTIGTKLEPRTTYFLYKILV